MSPSRRNSHAWSASQSRAADSANVSSTVCRSKVERLMTLSTSAVAISRARASASSRRSAAMSVFLGFAPSRGGVAFRRVRRAATNVFFLRGLLMSLGRFDLDHRRPGEPADTFDQIGRPEHFLDQNGLHARVQALAILGVEIA